MYDKELQLSRDKLQSTIKNLYSSIILKYYYIKRSQILILMPIKILLKVQA